MFMSNCQRGLRRTTNLRETAVFRTTLAAGALAVASCSGSDASQEDLATRTPVRPDRLAYVTGTFPATAELIALGGEGGVSVAPNGSIYVSNFNSSVWVLSPDGEVTVLTDEFRTASGNYVLPNGLLLQADFRENKLIAIDSDGKLQEFSAEGLQGPVGITQAGDGSIYVANCLGKYVSRIREGGGPAEIFARDDRFSCPNGILAIGDTIYVADLQNSVLFKITPGGDVLEHADLGGPGNGHLTVVGSDLYITQLRAHKIVRLSANGEQRVVAGTGEHGFEDGPEGVSTIRYPNGIAASPDGTILYFNTYRGVMRGGNRGSMIMRMMYRPTG